MVVAPLMRAQIRVLNTLLLVTPIFFPLALGAHSPAMAANSLPAAAVVAMAVAVVMDPIAGPQSNAGPAAVLVTIREIVGVSPSRHRAGLGGRSMAGSLR